MSDIFVECNMKIVDYLDVTFDFDKGTYKPYEKRNSEMKNIHIASDQLL